jgi:hypothetical protein
LGKVKASTRDDPHKVILDCVVTTVLAIALGIVLSIGAVSLIDNYLGPIDQAEAHYPSVASQPAR